MHDCWMTHALFLQDALESIVDMREHDVPYHVRFEIDCDVRCGHWYTVKAKVRGREWLLVTNSKLMPGT